MKFIWSGFFIASIFGHLANPQGIDATVVLCALGVVICSAWGEIIQELKKRK